MLITKSKICKFQIIIVAAPKAAADAKRMDYLAVPSSSKLVGIALATSAGAEEITVAISKALASKGITNVVIQFVEDPTILPFISKTLAETCDVILAIAVLSGDGVQMSQFLTKALTETGLASGCPVIPAMMAPSSYLELKASLPACSNVWSNSISSILAVKGGVQAIAVGEIVSEQLLAAAAILPTPVTAETTNKDDLLNDLRESFKVFSNIIDVIIRVPMPSTIQF